MNIPFDKLNVSFNGGVLRAFKAMITSMNNECLVNVLTSMMCRHLNCVCWAHLQERGRVHLWLADWTRPCSYRWVWLWNERPVL